MEHMSEAEYMSQMEDIDMPEVEEELLYSKLNNLVTELAIVGRRIKGTNKVVLDVLSYEKLILLAWGAYAQGDYNAKYERTAVDVLEGRAHYLTRQKGRLVLMGFIRPFIDRRVKELFK